MSAPSLTLERGEGLDAWERAYLRFQTAEQEVEKFVGRLRLLGVDRWDRGLRVAELFCGRGNGLAAWLRLGFEHVEGLDLSEALLGQYRGAARVRVGDARSMPFEDGSRDVICIQGGLHHLSLHGDLEKVLGEIHRVLSPTGRLVLVEPWLTPFLRVVHAACGVRPLRSLTPRLEALATMIDLERATYEAWLAAPQVILAALRRVVEPATLRIRWGKLMLVGTRRPLR